MEEAQHLIKLKQQQQPIILQNSFPQGKNMQVGSSTSNTQGDTPSATFLDELFNFVNMVNHTNEEEVYFMTRAHDYSNPESSMKGKETFNPQRPLHIEKPEKETMMRIPKDVYKRESHNPNSRVMPNYSIIEDLAQMTYVMSSLEVI